MCAPVKGKTPSHQYGLRQLFLLTRYATHLFDLCYIYDGTLFHINWTSVPCHV
ncbi:hypothetical protein HMPREF1991_00089 [Hoylesella loescheii DSM 19665 = JCM 12249 = ATCC 15930]|uniref:Uncharacterized protein n=1 Tax=Hoylesella loescheii DSM 19665 = JCM 12249 = ATCC 15930 TaxID=1122985 RepID=A0A069QLJ2_HOYLO|nr:hypothetical protein HMPREF1991_00089 [Hoylesella loescheii DSM 19665 = JCM 12249 = ATCC 15930]